MLETVKTEYAGNPTVRFLLVNPGSEGDTPEKVSSFLQRKPTSIPVALNPGQSFVDLCEKLNDSAIPLLVVLDRHGHIRYCQYGSDANTNHELHAEIDTLLAAH